MQICKSREEHNIHEVYIEKKKWNTYTENFALIPEMEPGHHFCPKSHMRMESLLPKQTNHKMENDTSSHQPFRFVTENLYKIQNHSSVKVSVIETLHKTLFISMFSNWTSFIISSSRIRTDGAAQTALASTDNRWK